MSPIKTVLRLLSSNRLTILIFHHVPPAPDPIFPEEAHAARFDEMMGWIGSWFDVLPLDHAVERLKAGTLPPRAASISFDDGYADNYSQALPILRKHGLCATFFIATRYLDGGCMWNDRIIASIRNSKDSWVDLGHLRLGCHDLSSDQRKREAIDTLIGRTKYLAFNERDEISEYIAQATGTPADLRPMMTSAEVRELYRSGMQIGAHTVSHPILANLKLDLARKEIAAGKDQLEELIGSKINSFAYPNGKPGNDYLPEHVELVRSLGFTAAVSTSWGTARESGDFHQLPRFTPWNKLRLPFAMNLMKNLLR